MKLSEALRLGEFALEPIHGKFYEIREGKVCGGCAVGRACTAAGYVPTDELRLNWVAMNEFFTAQWPWTTSFLDPRPEDRYHRYVPNILAPQFSIYNPKTGNELTSSWNPMLREISNLYEHDRWSLPQIAAWVEQFEPADETPTPATEPVKEVTHAL